jgi:hypothetical protein
VSEVACLPAHWKFWPWIQNWMWEYQWTHLEKNKKCCISDEVDVMVGNEEMGNVVSEHDLCEEWMPDRWWELWRHWSWDRRSEWWTDSGDFKKEANLINFTCNMFSGVYFLSHVYSQIMILIREITFSVQTFPCCTVILHSELSSTEVNMVIHFSALWKIG